MRSLVLSHPRRKDQVHVLTLDPVLGTDIEERLTFDPRMVGCKVIRPKKGDIDATVTEIERMAPKTVASRLLVLDVRRHTLPRLQHAYNKVVGYNRIDLNGLCYSMVIGDGPMSLFNGGTSLEVFAPHLATLRTDYHAAVFFYDPFLHYTADEDPSTGIDQEYRLPDRIPKRLAKVIKEEKMPPAEVRRYFRAAAAAPEKREKSRARREQKLIKLFRKRIAKAFPHQKDELAAWLSREGMSISGEALSLNLYPLFFEDWAFQLMRDARRAADPRRAPRRPEPEGATNG